MMTTQRFIALLALAMAPLAGCSSDSSSGTTGTTGGTTASPDTSTTTGGSDAGTTTTAGGDDAGATTAAGDDAGDTGGTGDGGTTGGDAPPCAAYCDKVTASCTGANAQYADEAGCLAYCGTAGKIPAGAAADTTGNTIGCRTYHATVAGSEPGTTEATHCPHAGPTGGNVCGTWCENYCHLAMTNCTGQNAIYADSAACMTACAAITVSQSTDAVITSGDSIQCRIYHLGVAGSEGDTSAAVHCPHGKAAPTEICVDAPAFDFRTDAPDKYARVDRMGMPAVATALITSKDSYNAANPSDDAALTFASELIGGLAGLHQALDDDLSGLGLTPCTVVGDGSGTCVTQGAPLIIPDTLKIDTSSPAGFPNGRRLTDPAVDVTLSVILLDLTVHDATTFVGVLNPPANDVPFQPAFPYLAPPHSL